MSTKRSTTKASSSTRSSLPTSNSRSSKNTDKTHVLMSPTTDSSYPSPGLPRGSSNNNNNDSTTRHIKFPDADNEFFYNNKFPLGKYVDIITKYDRTRAPTPPKVECGPGFFGYFNYLINTIRLFHRPNSLMPPDTPQAHKAGMVLACWGSMTDNERNKWNQEKRAWHPNNTPGGQRTASHFTLSDQNNKNNENNNTNSSTSSSSSKKTKNTTSTNNIATKVSTSTRGGAKLDDNINTNAKNSTNNSISATSNNRSSNPTTNTTTTTTTSSSRNKGTILPSTPPKQQNNIKSNNYSASMSPNDEEDGVYDPRPINPNYQNRPINNINNNNNNNNTGYNTKQHLERFDLDGDDSSSFYPTNSSYTHTRYGMNDINNMISSQQQHKNTSQNQNFSQNSQNNNNINNNNESLFLSPRTANYFSGHHDQKIQLERQIRDLMVTLDEMTNERNYLVERCNQNDAQITTLQKKNNDLSEANTNAAKFNKHMTERFQEVMRVSEDLFTKISQSHDEKAELAEQITTLNKQIEENNHNYEVLEENNNQLVKVQGMYENDLGIMQTVWSEMFDCLQTFRGTGSLFSYILNVNIKPLVSRAVNNNNNTNNNSNNTKLEDNNCNSSSFSRNHNTYNIVGLECCLTNEELTRKITFQLIREEHILQYTQEHGTTARVVPQATARIYKADPSSFEPQLETIALKQNDFNKNVINHKDQRLLKHGGDQSHDNNKNNNNGGGEYNPHLSTADTSIVGLVKVPFPQLPWVHSSNPEANLVCWKYNPVEVILPSSLQNSFKVDPHSSTVLQGKHLNFFFLYLLRLVNEESPMFYSTNDINDFAERSKQRHAEQLKIYKQQTEEHAKAQIAEYVEKIQWYEAELNKYKHKRHRNQRSGGGTNDDDDDDGDYGGDNVKRSRRNRQRNNKGDNDVLLIRPMDQISTSFLDSHQNGAIGERWNDLFGGDDNNNDDIDYNNQLNTEMGFNNNINDDNGKYKKVKKTSTSNRQQQQQRLGGGYNGDDDNYNNYNNNNNNPSIPHNNYNNHNPNVHNDEQYNQNVHYNGQPIPSSLPQPPLPPPLSNPNSVNTVHRHNEQFNNNNHHMNNNNNHNNINPIIANNIPTLNSNQNDEAQHTPEFQPAQPQLPPPPSHRKKLLEQQRLEKLQQQQQQHFDDQQLQQQQLQQQQQQPNNNNPLNNNNINTTKPPVHHRHSYSHHHSANSGSGSLYQGQRDDDAGADADNEDSDMGRLDQNYHNNNFNIDDNDYMSTIDEGSGGNVRSGNAHTRRSAPYHQPLINNNRAQSLAGSSTSNNNNNNNNGNTIGDNNHNNNNINDYYNPKQNPQQNQPFINNNNDNLNSNSGLESSRLNSPKNDHISVSDNNSHVTYFHGDVNSDNDQINVNIHSANVYPDQDSVIDETPIHDDEDNYVN